MKRKISAFTLAEVLIALGVIGVIAAITIPNVVKKYQEYVIKKQFAKFYSNISQAYLRAYNDNDMAMGCYYRLNNSGVLVSWNGDWTVCMNEGKEAFKYLKVIKTCLYRTGENKCIKQYPKIYATYYYDNYNFLNDGTVVISPELNALLYFVVDLNGAKRPNKWGYDIFEFITVKDRNRFYIAPYPNHRVEEGGKSTKEMLESLNK